MIVTDEEQGYAPAAHLEAIDKTYDTVELDCIINEGRLIIIIIIMGAKLYHLHLQISNCHGSNY